MKKIILFVGSLALTMSVGSVSAGCIGPVVNGNCLTGVDDAGGSNSGGYQGSSGSNYQYDMNNGSDRNSYSIDLDAQRRDQMYNGVGRSQDRLRGQNGGGIYGN